MTNTFITRNIKKINLGLTITYFVMMFLNGWWCYEAYLANNIFGIINNAFSAGMFFAIALFFTMLINQLKRNEQLMTDNIQLIVDNHELAHEIMVLKMPKMGKTEQHD